MTRPTYGSLFSGVGGMDLGFDAYMDCVFQVEWDKHASSILRRHWPHVPKWSDVRDVDGATLPPCDVLTFGSPCQDLSAAGKRAGIDGDRSSMFFEAIRIMKEMRDATKSGPTGPFPRVAVWENVPGALTSNRGHDFRVVLDSLGDIGSQLTEWAVLDAQHFGVPQRRRRIFLVAIFDPAVAKRSAGEVLPVCEGRARDFASGRKKGKDATGAVAQGFGSGGEPIEAFTGTSHAQYGEGVGTLRANGGDLGGGSETLLTFTKSKPAQTVDDNEPHISQPYSFDTQFGSNANVFTDLSPTLKATQAAPSVTTTYAVRRLTPLECERLMGWPDDHTRWTDDGREQADSHRYKQCGNGVATPVARWIAGHIKDIL